MRSAVVGIGSNSVRALVFGEVAHEVDHLRIMPLDRRNVRRVKVVVLQNRHEPAGELIGPERPPLPGFRRRLVWNR